MIINFEDTDGNKVKDSNIIEGLEKGTTYATDAPEIEGYAYKNHKVNFIEADGQNASVPLSSDVVITFVYYKLLTLNISYVDTTGLSIKINDLITVKKGEPHNIKLPVIERYEPIGSMDVTMTPVYLNENITFAYKKVEDI